VFYSTKNPVTIKGHAENWISTGQWDEKYKLPSEFRFQLLHRVSRFHQDNATINDHVSFCINAKFCGIFRRFDNFISTLKRNWINSSKPFNISHIFRSIITWSQPKYWRKYYIYINFELKFAFVKGVGTLRSTVALIVLYYCVETNKNLDMYSVFNRQENGWRSFKKCLRVIQLCGLICGRRKLKRK